MGEYQERPKRSSSNNNKNLPPIQAYEQYMYGGGFPEADRSPLPITPELIEQLEKEDEELFLRFGSTPVYNKLKKKETPKNRLSKNKQDGLSFNEASISKDKHGYAISDERDKAISKDKTDIAISDKRDIAGFSQAEKLLEVLNLTIQKLPSALGSQLKALINPTSIAVMVGVLGAYTASHAVGVGFIADAVMGVGAGVFLGWQAVDVAKDLWAFVNYVNATTPEELDKAAEHLAKAIMTVGFDVILGILTKKAAGKVSQHVDELKQVDEVHVHHDPNANAGNLDNADNVNAGRGSDLDNINQNQGREVQRIPDTDSLNSSLQEGPGFKGSGPAPGFLEISSGVRSTGAIESLNPNRPMDFVFDPVNKRFVVGSRKRPFGHDGIMDAAGRGIRNPNSVGGRIGRRDGILYTDEWSGHYGMRWNNTLRQQFESFKQEFGLDIPHLFPKNQDHLTK